MKRRAMILALAQVVVSEPDQWAELEQVWNPFAAKMNQGIVDRKQWKRVVAVVNKIDGNRCK